jgi:hypothetical protein
MLSIGSSLDGLKPQPLRPVLCYSASKINNTTSPSASCAWCVMPTMAMSPSIFSHSWSSFGVFEGHGVVLR